MPRYKTRCIFFIVVITVLAGIVGASIAYQQGWHRMLVRYLYARMLQGEIVAQNTIMLPPGDSPYNLWVAANRTRIPMFEGVSIDDVTSQPLPPWPAMGDGVSGLYLRFADYQLTDGRLLQIPAGGSTSRESHLYEVGTYFFGGPGYTLIEIAGEAPQRVDWQEGSLVSIPLMAVYRHFNLSDEPVRLLSVTSFPFVINAFGDEEFVQADMRGLESRNEVTRNFLGFNEQIDERRQRLNFVLDALTYTTAPNRSRGSTNSIAYWRMAGNTMLEMHISEFGPTSYKRAHRHTSDAFILILSGKGYSLAWKEGNLENRLRIEWRPGTLFVPPNYWYHQHFNTSSEAARYLVINPPSLVKHLGLSFYDQLDEYDSDAVREWKRVLEVQSAQPDAPGIGNKPP